MCKDYCPQGDCQGEGLARSLRKEFGEVKWLAGWTRLSDNAWSARLSDPRVPGTTEAAGPSRFQAIQQASTIRPPRSPRKCLISLVEPL